MRKGSSSAASTRSSSSLWSTWTAQTWLWTAGILLLSTLATVYISAQSSELDYKLYTPGEQVKRWKSDYDLNLSDLGGSDLQSYAQDVGVNRVAPVIIVGVLCFIGLLIWTCCRCCGKCRLSEASGCCKFVMVALLLGTLVAGIALIGVGLDADREQSDAMESVPDAVDSVVSFVDETAMYVANLSMIADRLSDNAAALIAADNGTGVITEDTVEDLNITVTTIRDLAGTVDDEVDRIDFSDFEDFSDKVDNYNEQRHLGFVIVLAVLLALVLLEGAFALLNAFAGESCKPKENCMKYFTPIIGTLAIIILLLLWILSGALVGIMTASSDVCYDPNTQFTNLLQDTSNDADVNELIEYYINCGADETLVNPFNSEIAAIRENLKNATDLVSNLQQELNNEPNCMGMYNDTCESIKQELDMTEVILVDLSETLGANSTDSRGNPREGFLRLAGCYGLNERYNIVLNTFCGDAVEALGKSTEVVLGFAVIYVFTQILIRLVTDTGLEDEDKLV